MNQSTRYGMDSIQNALGLVLQTLMAKRAEERAAIQQAVENKKWAIGTKYGAGMEAGMTKAEKAALDAEMESITGPGMAGPGTAGPGGAPPINPQLAALSTIMSMAQGATEGGPGPAPQPAQLPQRKEPTTWEELEQYVGSFGQASGTEKAPKVSLPESSEAIGGDFVTLDMLKKVGLPDTFRQLLAKPNPYEVFNTQRQLFIDQYNEDPINMVGKPVTEFWKNVHTGIKQQQDTYEERMKQIGVNLAEITMKRDDEMKKRAWEEQRDIRQNALIKERQKEILGYSKGLQKGLETYKSGLRMKEKEATAKMIKEKVPRTMTKGFVNEKTGQIIYQTVPVDKPGMLHTVKPGWKPLSAQSEEERMFLERLRQFSPGAAPRPPVEEENGPLNETIDQIIKNLYLGE